MRYKRKKAKYNFRYNIIMIKESRTAYKNYINYAYISYASFTYKSDLFLTSHNRYLIQSWSN